jgi:3-isopropylmalate/(R)-2-methylmalate dehydratase small subunit
VPDETGLARYNYNQSVDAFTTHTGTIAVVSDDNIDTDRIIPARFLTRISRFGYGELLFNDVRGGDFPLDQPQAQGATILVTGTNFGCGSSREHAVWAIQQAGYRAVLAKKTETSPGYSDIFRQNAANCGLLLIELWEEDHRKLIAAGSGAEVTIDLPNQTVLLNGETMRFDMNAVAKDALIRGLDLIGTTLIHADDITRYEQGHDSYAPSAGGI